LVLIQSTVSTTGLPGVKMALMPAFLSTGISSSGIMPPPKTGISSAPFSVSSSIIWGKRYRGGSGTGWKRDVVDLLTFWQKRKNGSKFQENFYR